MSKLWEKKFELNIEEIDNQHRIFFEMLETTDDLIEKVEISAKDVFELLRLIMEFRSYGLHHFHTEERLMVEKGYGEIFGHIELHDKYIKKMSTFRIDFLSLFTAYKGGEATQEEIKNFVASFVRYTTEWYQNHISNVDSKYAYFIKKQT